MSEVKRIVNTKFWDDKLVLNSFSPEDKLFMLYLLTNPHTTQLGIYYLPVKYIPVELGYSKETVDILLDRFERVYGVIAVSKTGTGEIAVKNYLKHSVVKGGKPVFDCLVKEMMEIKDVELLASTCFHMERHIADGKVDNSTVKDFISYMRKYVDSKQLGEETDFVEEEVIRPKETKDDIEANFEALWRLYPRRSGKGKVSPKQKQRIFNVGYEQMVRCIDRFKQDKVGTEERFLPYGSTFFNSGYVDYLDENFFSENKPKGSDSDWQ